MILEAVSLAEWERACDYVLDFLYDKKIALLTYGYEKYGCLVMTKISV